MVVPRTGGPNRLRNVFIAGIVLGILVSVLVGALTSDKAVSGEDIEKINSRLAGIESKLATPTPLPEASASPGASSTTTISALNKDPNAFTDKVVDITGKVNSPHQGVGFILVDADGTFLWIHSKDKIPSGSVTVHGKVTKLTDQINQWRTEPGWPADDATLISKLRNEKIFIETVGVS